jgi:outer membrane cobalamin receptor
MSAKDTATGLDLPNRPRFTAAVALTHALPRHAAVTASLVVVGERNADAAGMIRLPAYLTSTLTAQVPLGAGAELRLTVQNLFDARYEPVLGYPTPGRTLFGEIVLRR